MSQQDASDGPVIVSVAAPSGSGKTTLIEALLPRLADRGLRVGAIKSDAHRVELDTPGKDSHRMRKAGAVVTGLVSQGQIGLFLDGVDESIGRPELAEVVRVFFRPLDLVLAEGFRSQGFPTLVIRRRGVDAGGWQWPDHVIALATDEPAAARGSAPVLDLDDPDAVAAFLVQELALGAGP